jgi:regulator of protease activity HflC (stomatin/prohibitin superfamily)
LAAVERVGVKSVSLRTDPKTRTVPEVTLTSCVNATSVDVVDATGTSVVTDPRRVYEYTTWVRYYPQSAYPQVGEGVDGWVVGQYENKEIAAC